MNSKGKIPIGNYFFFALLAHHRNFMFACCLALMAVIRNYTHPPFMAKSQLPKLFLSRSCNTGLWFYLHKKQDTNVYVNCMDWGLWNMKWKCSAYLAANEVILLKTTYQF